MASRFVQWARALGVTVLVLGVVSTVQAGAVVLHSGNGDFGSTDSQITMLVGPGGGDFGPLTASDFSAADTGPNAFVIGNHGAWVGSLSSDPSARWIATNPGGASGGNTALFAQQFFLPGGILDASLDLHFAVDNGLGGENNQGVFINGVAVSGDTRGGGFSSEFVITRNDIAGLLIPGWNTLYIDAVNAGGPAGLIYSATITYTSAAPEPSTLVSMALAGVAGLVVYRRRRSV